MWEEITKHREEVKSHLKYLKKPLFTSKVPPGKRYLNACLHIIAEHDPYARGYKLAADLLVEYVEESRNDQDSLVYPIVFAYRHYLEVRLKHLIYINNELLDIGHVIPKTHDLSKLLDGVMPIIKQHFPRDVPYWKDIKARLKEFNSVDPASDAFRYYVTGKGEISAETTDKINLWHLKSAINAISIIMDNSSAGLEESLRIKQDTSSCNC